MVDPLYLPPETTKSQKLNLPFSNERLLITRREDKRLDHVKEKDRLLYMQKKKNKREWYTVDSKEQYKNSENTKRDLKK